MEARKYILGLWPQLFGGDDRCGVAGACSPRTPATPSACSARSSAACYRSSLIEMETE